LRLMVEEAFKSKRMPMVTGQDQGIHNYLIWSDLLPNLHVHDNGTGSVLTMGVMKPQEIHLNAEQEVVLDDGRVAPVLHQYDRHPQIVEAVNKQLKRGNVGSISGS